MANVYTPRPKESYIGPLASLAGMAFAGPPGAAIGGIVGGQLDKSNQKQFTPVATESSAMQRRMESMQASPPPQLQMAQVQDAIRRLPELNNFRVFRQPT